MHTATIMPTSQTARVAMHAALRRCVRHMSTAAAASPASATPPPPLPQVSLPLASRAAPSSLDSRVTLLSGHSMPVLGLGTWRAAAGEVGQAVTHALDAGYRAIDGAAVYQNEAEVGQAIRQWIDKTGKSRESLFVTSKLWNTHHDPAHVESALRRTLSQLQLSYLDLYLIHWPVCFRHVPIGESGEAELYPKGSGRNAPMLFPDEDVPLERTWEAMIKLRDAGLVRSIGVSNCTSAQVAALIERFGRDGPAVNQVESHPFCAQTSMQSKLNALGVHITAYSPLGNIHAAPPSAGIKASAGAKPPPPSPMQHEVVRSIASRLGVTPAQVLIRWNLQLNRIVIPKSVRAERIRENADVFHFSLSESDMQAIAQLNQPPTQYRFLNPSSFKRTPRKYFFTEFE